MKSADKFLIGIVVGVALLVVVAFVVVLTFPKPGYQSDSSPEGIAYNYLFALQQQDFERAYSYLSPSLRGYPRSIYDFQIHLRDNHFTFELSNSPEFAVESTQTSSDGQRATVRIRARNFYSGGLFGRSESTSTFQMQLVRLNNQWKIESSERFWLHCWEVSSGCPS